MDLIIELKIWFFYFPNFVELLCSNSIPGVAGHQQSTEMLLPLTLGHGLWSSTFTGTMYGPDVDRDVAVQQIKGSLLHR